MGRKCLTFHSKESPDIVFGGPHTNQEPTLSPERPQPHPHGKIHGFVLRLPPQHKPHETFMQPLQYVLQHHVANLHLSTHMATPDHNNHAAIQLRSATTDSRNAKNYAHRTNHSLQDTDRNPLRPERPQPCPPREVPFIAGCSHFTGKVHGFVLRIPAQHKPHATFMQPLQCILQHHVTNLHHSTRMATPDHNNHAAIPMRSATADSRNAERTTHIDTTTRCRTQRRNPLCPERPQPHPPHTTRYLSSP